MLVRCEIREDGSLAIRGERRETVDGVYVNGRNIAIKYGDGDVQVAKCDELDAFDLEKGVMICLLKHYGVSTSKVQEVCAKANYRINSKKADKAYKKFRREIDEAIKYAK